MLAVNTALQPPSVITRGATTTTTVSVSWSPVLGATGYYVSYQRQDLGAPPVVTPQYERIVGGATSVTLSGLEPGTTYRIRVWSTNGTSVSNGSRQMDVTTVESGEKCHKSTCVQWKPYIYIYAHEVLKNVYNSNTLSYIVKPVLDVQCKHRSALGRKEKCWSSNSHCDCVRFYQ